MAQSKQSRLLHTDGLYFTDSQGNCVFLRGVNLSGASKCPYNTGSHDPFGQDITFVGRPFPLSEADQHFGRLQHWGFNFLRYNITWESLEHKGPGFYDEEYIAYVIAILKKAKLYDFRCFIDPHQDVWSRFSGGSGAPAWTFEKAGLNIHTFGKTEAALLHNSYEDPGLFPKMIWPTNYYKLAAATMFTLFFGGKMFAPKCVLPDGSNIQDFLQRHYFSAFAYLAQKISESTAELLDNVVIGYDTLNEPSPGWIGVIDLAEFPEDQQLKNGHTPTPFQCMLLGQGFKVTVETWGVGGFGPFRVGSTRVDPKRTTAWLDGQCLWAKHGVWDAKTKKLLKPDYFSKAHSNGLPVEFLKDCWKPFVVKFTRAMRAVHPQAIMFIEPPVNAIPPVFDSPEDPKTRIVFTPHWYDGITLLNKDFNPWFTVDVIGMLRGRYWSPVMALKFGEIGIKDCFQNQLQTIKQEGLEALGRVPCVFGEIGIPFDMKNKLAYLTGDYDPQLRAMDANIHALEKNLLCFTLWNYCPQNSHTLGDQWNGEDLSIWSRSLAPWASRWHSTEDLTTPEGTSSAIALGKYVDGKEAVAHPAEMGVHYEPFHSLSTSPSAASKLFKAFSSETRLNRMPRSYDFDKGGRAVRAFCRPYPIRVPGEPLSVSFDMRARTFRFHFAPHPYVADDESLEVEIYIPSIHFPSEDHFYVDLSHGVFEFRPSEQRLLWIISPEDRRMLTSSTSALPNVSGAKSSPSSYAAVSSTEYWILIQHHDPSASHICPKSCSIM